MSKELIERLRADAESTDDIGLCADAADRIEELERKVASRDAEVAKLKDDNEYLYVAAIERDQLRAHINVLREALLTCSVGDFSTSHVMYPSFDEELVEEALAATESAAKARDMLPEYYSGSCEDVAQAVDREMALRDRAEQLEADRENLLQLLESASEVIGRFVSDEGWAQSDMDMMDTIDAKIASMRRAAQ